MALNQWTVIIYLVVCTTVHLALSEDEQQKLTVSQASCNVTDWVKYTSILAVAGWGSFIILTTSLLIALCTLKQQRIRVESELFNLKTASRHRMLVMPDPRAEQTIANNPNTPAVISTTNAPSGASNKPYLNSGGTSYYPPTSTAFECTGQRWAPAKNMPGF